MHQIKNLIKIISIICLSSTGLVGCQTIDSIETEQCSIFLAFDDEDNVLVNESLCACRMYKHSAEFIGASGTTREEPLERCNRMTGYRPDEYTKLFFWKDDIRKKFGKRSKR